MKKMAENRYPNSATLFKFCKEALNIRYDGNVKVIDQDVGAILGYDPADCSHWKKGKKNIRALGSLKDIADHLSIDERLLIDVASGRMGLEEAVFEYKGYGEFRLEGKSLDLLKKEFFKNPTKWQTDGVSKSFEELFQVNEETVIAAANTVIEMGQFAEVPIYIPEVFNLFAGITLEEVENLGELITVAKTTAETGTTQTTIKLRKGAMRPYVRFILAKELFKHLCAAKDPIVAAIADAPDEIRNIQSNIFAAHLLIPDVLLKQEVQKVDMTLDIVTQLTTTFWVSKSLMNRRLRNYLEKVA